jgi:hypothetical protein
VLQCGSWAAARMAVLGVIPQCNITTLGRSCTWAERSALITMCWLQGHTRLLWGMLIGEK